MSEKPNWIMGVRIPPGRLEEMMLYAYSIGASLIDFTPEYRDQLEAMAQGVSQLLPAPNGQATPQITVQRTPKKSRRINFGEIEPGTCRAFILKYLRRRPRTSKELRDLALSKKVTWEVKGIDSRMHELRERGWVFITPRGWALTDEGLKYSEGAMGTKPATAPSPYRPRRSSKGNKKTIAEIVEARLREAFPGIVTLKDLREGVAKHKLRENSTSTIITFLKAKGIIAAGAEAATYTWIPPDKRQPQETK